MIKPNKSLVALGIGVFLLYISPALGETQNSKEVVVKGRVIDPVCLLTMNMKGDGQRECALNCAKAGENLAIMDEKGKIYSILAEKAVTNPNQPVLDYVEKTVTVKGTLIESGGVSYIVIKEVQGS
jgi:hypothetical protein